MMVGKMSKTTKLKFPLAPSRSIVKEASIVKTWSGPLDILSNVFGYDAFRGEQQSIVETVIEGKNAFVLMPTGGGKSLCYQIPSLARPGFGVIISPLISLMKDQVDTLRKKGVRAYSINSTMTLNERKSIENKMLSGDIDILYVAPERVIIPDFLDVMRKCSISVIGIDEAHCVSQWGNDFRPTYLRAAEVLSKLEHIPRIAVTATADPMTRRDIAYRLNLVDAPLFVSSFDRPNIKIGVKKSKSDPIDEVANYINSRRDQCGIIYRTSRQKVEKTCLELIKRGVNAVPYHAGMSDEDRKANQERFLNTGSVVMVATVAFGMGIDKPDVRYVIHMDLPTSLESYYQEIGRAGRDGKMSEALLFYKHSDFGLLRKRIMDDENLSDERKVLNLMKVNSVIGMVETPGCRRNTILRYFGEEKEDVCGRCDRCLDPQPTQDAYALVKLVMSASVQTGERFGMTHLINVLLGEKTERVRKLEHDKVSVFGRGAFLAEENWKSVIRQMIGLGFLEADMDTLGALKISGKARELFTQQKIVPMIFSWPNVMPEHEDVDVSSFTVSPDSQTRRLIKEKWSKLLEIFRDDIQRQYISVKELHALMHIIDKKDLDAAKIWIDYPQVLNRKKDVESIILTSSGKDILSDPNLSFRVTF